MDEENENFDDAEILSDGECNDDIDDSKNEFITENVSVKKQSDSSNDRIGLNRVLDNGSDDDDDTPLNIWLRNGWNLGKKRRPCFNPPFTESTGSKNFSEDIKDPGAIFLCLFSEQNMQLIVEQSNLYCKQKGTKFETITIDEIKKLLGLNLMKGIKRLPSYRDYWSSNVQLNDPYISSVMSVKRFSFILSHLHLNDNSKEPKKMNLDTISYIKLHLF